MDFYTNKKHSNNISFLELKAYFANKLLNVNREGKTPGRPSNSPTEPVKKRARLGWVQEIRLDGIGDYPNKMDF